MCTRIRGGNLNSYGICIIITTFIFPTDISPINTNSLV